MGQKLNELYGMLKVVEFAFPDLHNAASTFAAGCSEYVLLKGTSVDHQILPQNLWMFCGKQKFCKEGWRR
ncbi:hypothetical protein Tco_0032393 [Tanacetum coccineum]